MPAFFTQAPPLAVEIFSVAARPMYFQDYHMRSDPMATHDWVPVASNCLLVKNGGPDNNLTILCNSGPGLQLPESLRRHLGIPARDILLENLKRLGVGLGDIDVYIPDHGHWDHIGWAFENGEFKLPNAQVLMSRQAREDTERIFTEKDTSFLPEVPPILDSLEREGRLTLLDASAVSLTGTGATVPMLGNGITFFFSHGHSEGQVHTVFSTPFGSIISGGDFWPTAWHASDPRRYMPEFDQHNTAQLLAEKAAFLPRVARHGLYLYFYHDPQIIAGQVVSVGDAFELRNPLQEVCWWNPDGDHRVTRPVGSDESAGPSAETIENLIGDLEWGNREKSRQAEDALVEIGDAAVLPLINMLANRDNRVNLAVPILGRIGDPRAVEPLSALFYTDWWHGYGEAVLQALGEIGDETALNALLDLFTRHILKNTTNDLASRYYPSLPSDATFDHTPGYTRLAIETAIRKLGAPAVALLLQRIHNKLKKDGVVHPFRVSPEEIAREYNAAVHKFVVELLRLDIEDAAFRRAASEALATLKKTES